MIIPEDCNIARLENGLPVEGSHERRRNLRNLQYNIHLVNLLRARSGDQKYSVFFRYRIFSTVKFGLFG